MDGGISKATEFLVDKICSCFCLEVNHICSLDKNLEALENNLGILKARRDDVSGEVERVEDTGLLQRLKGVQVWLKAVETIEKQALEIKTQMACTSELQGLSLFCVVRSKKLVSRFRYGKEVFSMLGDVEELQKRDLTKDFNAVAVPPMRDVGEQRDLQQIIVGQETILESAWNHLMDEGTQIMGIYGMGGVGKTTLLDQINNKFCGANGFDKVIWVVVSKDKRNEKIQDEIAEKLGMSIGETWNRKTEEQKASKIKEIMKKKRFVLLLDDIWSKVELKDHVGVPLPTRENKCKIVFTTRLREVCVRMGVLDPIEVGCLDADKAWDLFKERVGENTLRSHRDIPELARKVAGKCHGLPLALNVIGETMSFQNTIQEWRHAIKTLTSSAAQFSGMDDMILPILKYSYDSLKKEHEKKCFLYCSLFPEDFNIRKDTLIEYWICEGFIQEKQGRENAFDEGHAILSTLVRACLLVEEESTYKVRMHDVMRELALWIESDLGKHKGRLVVKAGVGLREIPEVENWRSLRRLSLMNNEIAHVSESPDCPELTTLLLQENKLASISSEFFKRMPRLLVLDLSENSWFNGLPEKISELVALRYLNLSGSQIERLPIGLQESSKMLIYLNLESTRRLGSISGISKFSRLRRLGLWNSTVLIDVSLLKELQLLKDLEVVTIDIRSSLVAKQLSSFDRVVKCIQMLDIKDLEKESVEILTLPTMDKLRYLDIEKCGMTEIKTVGATSSWNKSPTTPSFLKLSTVSISKCNGLKDLTWLLFAPNLTILNVGHSVQLEYIISEEKAVTEKEAGTNIPFGNLEHFSFYNVPMLKSIYWSCLPFPCLRGIRVAGCSNLKKLPLGSNSVAKVEGFTIQCIERHWINGIEWEDEATKLRFQSSFI
ncbi:hypothetical protein EUTSA_v10006759mg [Eutrema salsugineum]|uniref:Formamidopyrimidine-DNA glycosylase catalytic domain-containing protein n=1 Tax=Eutrema salsugineum TaxID=72664 RepID=V4MUH1_EUTSA|nr:disease resistance protein RPS5 [Eutrema salsugineum]ESQ35601.1 hypothetical protein EUTSA_v10006759mg [Eutrema salsugineum]